ncbi:MAG TPA: hypothetical protein VGC79_03220 [Polyangiaceae bacterium]
MPLLSPIQVAAAIKFDNQRALDVLSDFRSALKVEGPDEYDATLVESIAKKQAEQALTIDGKVGQRTRELLSALQIALPARALWPADAANEAAKAAHYRALCAKLGFETTLARPLLLALRGVELRGNQTHPVLSVPRYDDAFVLLTRVDSTIGTREFVGATHPYQRSTNAAGTPDVNSDGLRDVGTIKPGSYLLRRQEHKPPGHPSLQLVKLDGKDGIPTFRDTNHDGTISGPEFEPPLLATEVLLHPGFSTNQNGKSVPYSSIGCQTAKVEDVQAVAEHALVDYLLVDARVALTKLATV